MSHTFHRLSATWRQDRADSFPFVPTSLIAFWFVNVQSIGFTLGLVMISSNIGGYTKRSIVSAMVFAAYCAGNMAGPQFIYESEKPRYRSGAYAM